MTFSAGMQGKCFARLLAVAALFALPQCATTRPAAPPREAAHPAWVAKTPSPQDKICAVGTCEPTFFPEDAKPCAAENARAELAKSVSVRMQSIMVEKTRNSESRVDSAKVSGMKGWVTDAVLNESVVEEYWYDAKGEVSHAPGVTYALACIPKSKVAAAREK